MNGTPVECGLIRLTDVTKTFGDVTALTGLSFHVSRGECVGLLGPNGAGKTTTIHLLLGALRPDSGQVEVGGTSDPTDPEVRRRFGVAPQSLALYPDLTGEENITFFGRLYGLRGATLRECVSSALEFAGLTERRGSRVKTYSGGMKRRLNLACALVHDPVVILLDEPTVGIDPQSRYHILENIEGLRREGRTVLYSTHYMEEAERLCDRVVILDHGKLLADDSVEVLLSRHGGGSLIRAEFERPPVGSVSLPGTLVGNSLTHWTDDPLPDVARLASSPVALRSLRVDGPNLERVFLNLTGRRLRDG